MVREGSCPHGRPIALDARGKHIGERKRVRERESERDWFPGMKEEVYDAELLDTDESRSTD